MFANLDIKQWILFFIIMIIINRQLEIRSLGFVGIIVNIYPLAFLISGYPSRIGFMYLEPLSNMIILNITFTYKRCL